MTKKASDKGYGFTPGGWKFVAIGFALLVIHNNLADAHSPFTWLVVGVSTATTVLLVFVGHRPSPRKLWTDRASAPSQQEGEDT